VRRQTPLLLLAVGGLAVAALVLPWPNVAAATGFVSGEDPTGVAALAAAELLIWVALLVGVVVVLARTLGNVRFRGVSAHVLVGMLLALGLAVLGVGLARHSSNEYSMCCGSISQARQQLANAP
jgi:vacuolar-type H+-ATPase subunit I/STV1